MRPPHVTQHKNHRTRCCCVSPAGTTAGPVLLTALTSTASKPALPDCMTPAGAAAAAASQYLHGGGPFTARRNTSSTHPPGTAAAPPSQAQLHNDSAPPDDADDADGFAQLHRAHTTPPAAALLLLHLCDDHTPVGGRTQHQLDNWLLALLLLVLLLLHYRTGTMSSICMAQHNSSNTHSSSNTHRHALSQWVWRATNTPCSPPPRAFPRQTPVPDKPEPINSGSLGSG